MASDDSTNTHDKMLEQVLGYVFGPAILARVRSQPSLLRVFVEAIIYASVTGILCRLVLNPPVWVIGGGTGYPAKYIIAKRDHRVLYAIFPQGTDGTETQTWSGPIRE